MNAEQNSLSEKLNSAVVAARADEPLIATVQSTNIWSSQDWASDPKMIEFSFGESLLVKAESALAFMRENDIHSVVIQNRFDYGLYKEAADLDDEDKALTDIIKGKDEDGNETEYIRFEPDYRLEQCCYAEIRSDGDIHAVFTLENVHDRLYCRVGNIEDLQSAFIAKM